MKEEKREIILSMTDFHVPYNDEKCNEVSFKFAKLINPKIIIIHEVIDFYSLSRFDKDPKRKLELQEDIDKTIKLLKKLRHYCPNTRIIMLESNHDKRLTKFLNSKAEELSYLRCLKFEELLKLNELNIEYKKSFEFRGVLFKHGDIVRKYSGYTAKAEFDKEGLSTATGHTHRLSSVFRTLRGGKYVSMESGCQCDLNPDYIEGTADWQQGCAIIAFQKGKKHFYPTVVPIISHKIMWGSKTII